jgi:hypothetical protein
LPFKAGFLNQPARYLMIIVFLFCSHVFNNIEYICRPSVEPFFMLIITENLCDPDVKIVFKFIFPVPPLVTPDIIDSFLDDPNAKTEIVTILFTQNTTNCKHRS